MVYHHRKIEFKRGFLLCAHRKILLPANKYFAFYLVLCSFFATFAPVNGKSSIRQTILLKY